jgi:hypothetical protein
MGGMGAVYEADDCERGERVAIKTLLDADPRALQRLKHEFRALQDIIHPNLVRLGELHEEDGQWFITMELVSGTDLLGYIRGDASSLPVADNGNGACETYDEARLRSAMRQLALGLRALHVAGKIHRDVKPSNVRVTPEGRVVLLDFGLLVDRSSARMSTEGNVVGSVAYMAPEQATAAHIEAAADWYAFGVTMFEALTGTTPFHGHNLQVLMEKMRSEAPPPSAFEQGIPADLDRLVVELLRIDPRERPPGEEVLRRLGANHTHVPNDSSHSTTLNGEGGPFFGRQSELARLTAAFGKVVSGHTVTVSVEGPSGIGKSALLARFVKQLSDSHPDALVLHGRCYERETARFKALDGIVDALASELSRMRRDERALLVPRRAALLKQLFPVLARVDVIARAPLVSDLARDAVEERRWMFAALRDLLFRLGEHRPLVIVIDDMHWADGDSLELLRALLEVTHEPPPKLLLLATAWHSWLNIGEFDSGAGSWPVKMHTIALAPLSDHEAEQLARGLLEHGNRADVDPGPIARESRGHPLFVAELTRRESLERRDSGALLTLEGAIWERAQTLPRPALHILKVLAIAAGPLPVTVLQLVSGLATDDLERNLGLLRLGAFSRSATGSSVRRVEHHHERVRAAVLEHLSHDERTALHASLAPVLEQEPGIDPEQVAQHYLDAHEPSKAADLFEVAARRAEEGFAFERAALLLRMQLELRPLAAPGRSDLYRRIGDALAKGGQAHAAADAYTQALEGAAETERARLRHLAATYYLRSGHVDEGLVHLAEVLQSVGLRMPKTRLTAILDFLWQRLCIRVRGYRVRLRDAAEIVPKALARIDALTSVAVGLAWVDGIRAAPLTAKALRLALSAGDPRRIIFGLTAEVAMVSLSARRPQQLCTKLLSRARSLAEKIDDVQSRGLVEVSEAHYRFNVADFSGCYEKSNEALRILDVPNVDAQWERASAHLFRILGLHYLGNTREMLRASAELMRDAEARRDRWLVSMLRMHNSQALLAGDFAAGRACIEDGYRLWREREPGLMHAVWTTASMALAVSERRWQEALAVRQREEGALRRSGTMRVRILVASIEVHTAAAHLQAYADTKRKTSLHAARASARALDSATAFGAALAAAVRAQVCLAEGTMEDALRFARDALHRLRALKTELYAALAAQLVGRLVGGDEGAALMAQAAGYFAREELRMPHVLGRPTMPYAFEPPG